jgi:RNA polymerase sigma-70 factor (ECF subfamily)
MLGSFSEADDAVQETWLRLHRTDAAAVGSLRAWLTTVVARVCLDQLRVRASRREESLDALAGAAPVEPHLPDPVVVVGGGGRADAVGDPERAALLADAVGIALLVVLDTLTPAERVAFVLHDLFGLPFDEIAPVVGRRPATARQLASRARRQVRERPVSPDADLTRQREVVDAFLSAAREGDLARLVAVLDPDVVVHAEVGAGTGRPGRRRLVRLDGAAGVAEQARRFAAGAALIRPALVNGAAGLVVDTADGPLAVLAFTVAAGRVAELDIYADPARLGRALAPRPQPRTAPGS